MFIQVLPKGSTSCFSGKWIVLDESTISFELTRALAGVPPMMTSQGKRVHQDASDSAQVLSFKPSKDKFILLNSQDITQLC